MSETVLELNNQIKIGERAWKIIPKAIKKDAKDLAKQNELSMDSWEIGRALGFAGEIIMEMEDEIKSSNDNLSSIRDLNQRDKARLYCDKLKYLIDVINYRKLGLYMTNTLLLTSLLADRMINLDRS